MDVVGFAETAATFSTAFVAVLVFLEARAIRHTEYLSRSVGLWQSFNELLMNEERARRWEQLLDGQLAPAEMCRADKHVLFSYINIIYLEYRYAMRGLIDRTYAETSIKRNLAQLAPNADVIAGMLSGTGYDDRFVSLLLDVDNTRLPTPPPWHQRFLARTHAG